MENGEGMGGREVSEFELVSGGVNGVAEPLARGGGDALEMAAAIEVEGA